MWYTNCQRELARHLGQWGPGCGRIWQWRRLCGYRRQATHLDIPGRAEPCATVLCQTVCEWLAYCPGWLWGSGRYVLASGNHHRLRSEQFGRRWHAGHPLDARWCGDRSHYCACLAGKRAGLCWNRRQPFVCSWCGIGRFAVGVSHWPQCLGTTGLFRGVCLCSVAR